MTRSLPFRPQEAPRTAPSRPAPDARFQVDPGLLRAAIKAAPRSDGFDLLAVGLVTRLADEVNLILAAIPRDEQGLHHQAEATARRVWIAAADLIRRSRYFDAYTELEALPGKLRVFLPQDNFSPPNKE